jgi:tetratricopeptide (TPR) repeat protein
MEAAAAVAKFAIDNWVLLSFIVAVATAVYVKFRFDIDYFESYRDVATKKMLSEFYRKLGDRMMVYGEWEPAEAAYRNSLEINPTNKQASFGVAKAGLFQPLKGQKFYAPDMVEAKLDFLIANVPGDAQLVFLKGFNRFLQGDSDESIRLFRQAIEIDPKFVGSYIQLGYMLMGAGEVEPAIENFKKALEIDASYSLTNNNLGYCYLITLRVPDAIKCYELSLKLCPTLLNTISLGDAYRLNGSFDDAHRLHAHAVRVLGEKGIEKERYVSGQWTYNFMPLREGDTQTIRQCVMVNTFEQKKMVTLAALAFDQALRGETIQADKTFAQSMAFDQAGDYHGFFANKIQSLLNLLKMSPGAHAWFEGKLRALTQPATGPAG